MRLFRHFVVGFINVNLVLLSCSSLAESSSFSFHVVSDIPYNREQEQILETKIVPALHQDPGPFVIHLGDIKSGGSPCTDELILQRLQQVRNMHPKATFYTPGDNEWTDCDSKNTQKPVSELEKLELIRQFYRANLQTYPKDLQVTSQPLFPENKQWFYRNVAFSTLHVVGSNGGRTYIDKDNVPFALSLAKSRDSANKHWLDRLFIQAKDNNAAAIIIGFHADITDHAYSEVCTDENPRKCNAFSELTEQLINLSAHFKKPVLVMHGDTSDFCLDNKLGADIAPNLWRLNSAGDYTVLDAVTVSVDLTNTSTPFSMSTLLTNEPPVLGCK